jgi:hypothetical protein
MTRLTRGDEVAIASISAREPTFRSDRGVAAQVAAVQTCGGLVEHHLLDRKAIVRG